MVKGNQAMGLKENIEAGNQAIAYVAGLNITSSNKVAHRLAAAGGVDACIGSDMGMRTGDLGPAGAGLAAIRRAAPANIDSLTQAAIRAGYGNCGELALIAAVHLREQGVRPVDVLYFGTQGYDHMWTMIGLDAGWQADNLRSWGADAVWVDPWQGDKGMCFSIKDFVAGKVRNLNAQYNCNTLERVEAGRAKLWGHIA
ncbi:MAG TPA: hypothetical protein ACFCUC_17880 [Desulfobacterales bacterium]